MFVQLDTGFSQAAGMKYTRFLSQLHQKTLFDWYLEVGCRTGDSFRDVRSKTVAVDPFFRVEQNVIHQKPELHVFQQTSDDFFANGFLGKIGAKLGFSFLDGMHLFEYLLRDFMNTEAQSSPDGVIALHDCCPFTDIMTTRDLENLPRGNWTGDVWKLIPILQKHRPDLTIHVLPCKPTGLVLVSGLNPNDRTLAKKYDEIVAEWQDVELVDYGPERFYDSFETTRAVDMLANPTIFEAAQLDPAGFSEPEFVTP